jgi:hypothetical protein
VAKRPRFSRWRRLPGVFRTGDHRPDDSGSTLDRLILYVPARILDLAEALAEKAGVATVQDYCALLLMEAIEKERVHQKVADIEARRGPLEGLHQIADDPDYLAEWQKRSDARLEGTPGWRPDLEPGGGTYPGDEPITVDIVLPDAGSLESTRPAPVWDDDLPGSEVEPSRHPGDSATGIAPVVSITRAVLKMTDSSASHVISRHTGSDLDPAGFLPCLRRGEPVPAAKSAELIYALNQLEEELKGAPAIDRKTAHGLHRLALESQVLLTDAWPGAFDDRVIAAIRTVQEAVERILSGEDIRYYPQSQSLESEREH